MSKLARLLPLASLLVLTACPGEGGPDEPDGGGQVRADPCNSKEDALSKPECELTLGEQKALWAYRGRLAPESASR